MPRFAFLHGFTQTGAAWRPLLAALESRCAGVVTEAICPDLPGHGGDTDGTADLWECARRTADRAGRAVYVGYSMGGRVALHCALAHPGDVAALVLISATAGIDEDAERADRRRADKALADRIEAIGVPSFLDEWLAQPLFAGLDPTPADREARRANSARGLADSLRHAGTGTQEPLWERLGGITVPTLVVAGSRDDKFTALAARLAGSLPRATLASIDGAGHAAHLEAPDACAREICQWAAHLPA